MFNKYSLTLLAIMATLLWMGVYTIYHQIWLGFIPLFLGGLMVKGFKTAEPSPKKTWVITFFGRKTSTLATSWPVLLLDWIPLKPVGYVEIEIAQKDHDFKMLKPILCSDNVYVEGQVSISFIADDSSARSLSAFDDIGRYEGFIKQVDDMLTSWMQDIANTHDSKYMETQGIEIKSQLIPKLEGVCGVANNENDPYDDTSGLGAKIEKFQSLLKAPEKVIHARNDSAVEKAQRKAEKYDTITINEQIRLRFKMYEDAGQPRTMKECREEVLEDRLLKAGKFQRISNPGGVNVVGANQAGGTTP